MPGLVRLLLVGFVLFALVTTALIIRRLRRPPRRTYASAIARGQPGDPSELPAPRAYTAFTFRPSERSTYELPAWDITGDKPAGPIIICTPGWGDSRLGVLVRLFALAPHASRIIAWDPAGLGDSPAHTRSALGTDADIEALTSLAQSLLTSDIRHPTSHIPPLPTSPPIILLGWSLGAGISIVAATRLPPHAAAAVIAEAPYRNARTPVINFLRSTRAPYTLQAPIVLAWLGLQLRRSFDWRTFDRALFASKLPCPLLVLHGTHDEICPHADGQSIAAAAAPRSLFISLPGAGHNNLWTEEPHRTQCERAIADFLNAVHRGGARPGG